MTVKIENIARGDLVEIVLTPDAGKYSDSIDFFMPDTSGEIDIPGRVRVGYVSKLETDSVWLSPGWNKPKNKPEEGGIRYYFDAVESWRKL